MYFQNHLKQLLAQLQTELSQWRIKKKRKHFCFPKRQQLQRRTED